MMLNPPTNGRLDITPNTTAPGGFMATYSCDEGHNLVGGIIRECQTDGSWTGSDPTCERKLNDVGWVAGYIRCEASVN